MTHAEKAMEKFMSGFNCAQAVLHTYSPELKFDPDCALRIANGFGAGMGRKQEVCGAVSGAILVIGLLYGRGENDGAERTEKTYATVRKLIEAFTDKYGSVSCRQLLGGCSLVTEEGRERFRDERLKEKCKEFAGATCEILDGIFQPATL
jgi:C_GCAxxG_C_C family probable redox protein